MARLVAVSNRVAIPSKAGAVPGGLAIALGAALRRTGGLWFGCSGQIASVTSSEPRIQQSGRVAYATVDLDQTDHDQFYVSFANSTLWPLFHYRAGLIEFTREAFAGYQRVNANLARLLFPLLRPDDVIWVHDYHLIPLGAELRKMGVDARIGFFLHTPFPAYPVLEILPGHADLLAAMAAYDLVGFQTETDRQAFLGGVDRLAGGEVGDDGVFRLAGRASRAQAFPIGIDVAEFAAIAGPAATTPDSQRLKASLVGRDLVIGVDRLDYSKGLPNRFTAFGQMLANWPEHRSAVTFLQIAPASRSDVLRYRQLRRELDQRAGRVNGKFAQPDWSPIRYLNRSFSRRTLAGFYRLARVGMVTPLRDGMNLVAKEYVAAQDANDPGVLILSRFAGAAAELTDALIVNPFDIDEMADALHRALVMSRDERRERWKRLDEAVRANTVADWRTKFLAALRVPAGVSR